MFLTPPPLPWGNASIINFHVLLNNLLCCHFLPIIYQFLVLPVENWATLQALPSRHLFFFSLYPTVLYQFGSVLTLSWLSKYCSPWLKSGIMFIFPFLYNVLFFLVLMPLFFHWLSSLCFKGAIKRLSLLLPKNLKWGFPGGSVIKNPPADIGDMCSIPGPGRSHMPWSSEPLVVQLLNQCSRAQEPWVLSLLTPDLVLHNKRSCNEKPDHWN